MVRGPYIAGVSCPSHALTGLDCPGCGSTRSIAALLHGDLATAFDHHLLVPLVLPLLIWSWVAWLTRGISGRRLSNPLNQRWASLTVLAVVLVFTVARNIDPLFGGWLAAGVR
ncbi:MAG: DUF2752 domain-containing protein [Aquihabitans sp.]